MHGGLTMNVATFSNDNMDYNDRILTEIADLNLQGSQTMGQLQKGMTWCAQPCGGCILPKLSLEVKLQPNLNKSLTVPKKKFYLISKAI